MKWQIIAISCKLLVKQWCRTPPRRGRTPGRWWRWCRGPARCPACPWGLGCPPPPPPPVSPSSWTPWTGARLLLPSPIYTYLLWIGLWWLHESLSHFPLLANTTCACHVPSGECNIDCSVSNPYIIYILYIKWFIYFVTNNQIISLFPASPMTASWPGLRRRGTSWRPWRCTSPCSPCSASTSWRCWRVQGHPTHKVVPQIDPSVKLYNHGEGPY